MFATHGYGPTRTNCTAPSPKSLRARSRCHWRYAASGSGQRRDSASTKPFPTAAQVVADMGEDLHSLAVGRGGVPPDVLDLRHVLTVRGTIDNLQRPTRAPHR